MNKQEFNDLTPFEQEQLRFQGWVIVALERIYDALLFNAMATGVDESKITGLIEDHMEHKYLFPEPQGDTQPEPQGDEE